MTRDAFLFLERYLHFADNSQFGGTGSGNRQRPSLFKIQPLLDILSENLKWWWTAGQKICIDESMILYKGRAVAFVQFMPAKPIKHGIKVFALCCAFTGLLLAFEVYTGADNASYSSNWELIEKLIISAGLTNAYGRILYTDNYYTSMRVARKLYELYHWLFVGTYKLTNKEGRGEDRCCRCVVAHGVDRNAASF
jgi:Transposase IS4